LRHEELLDAAHIIPDGEEGGDPIVPNGLSLCKLHHAAFDRQFLAIRPDYIIVIRADILKEKDGPMLLHGLKAMHNRGIILPRVVKERPSPVLLERRYERFQSLCL
jgi:putative restriction endonuclease